MKKLVVGALALVLLTGCSAPATEVATPTVTTKAPLSTEQLKDIAKVRGMQQAEQNRLKVEAEKKAAEEKAAAEEAARVEAERLAAEEAERKRIADLEAENQRIQKEAEQARIAEIERQQAEANRHLAERLERERAKNPPPAPKAAPPAPPAVPQWIAQAMQRYGYYAPANTVFLMTSDMGGCKAIRADAVGCTTLYADGRLEVRLATQDEFVLIHEIAHTLGARDECTADRIAREKTGRDVYPNCPR